MLQRKKHYKIRQAQQAVVNGILYQVSGNEQGTSFSHDTIAKEEI